MCSFQRALPLPGQAGCVHHIIQDAPLGNGPLVTVESRLSVCPLAVLMTYRKYTILAQKVFEI